MSTPTTLACLLLVLTALSLYVSQLRLRYRVSHGDGGHKDLPVAVRAHGNGLEMGLLYAVLLLAHAQVHSGPDAWVAAANAAFVTARVVQPLALFTRRLRLRQSAHLASMALQWVVAVRLLLAVAQ